MWIFQDVEEKMSHCCVSVSKALQEQEHWFTGIWDSCKPQWQMEQKNTMGIESSQKGLVYQNELLWESLDEAFRRSPEKQEQYQVLRVLVWICPFPLLYFHQLHAYC